MTVFRAATLIVLLLLRLETVGGSAGQPVSFRKEPQSQPANIEQYLSEARAWIRVDANQALPWLEKVFELAPDHREAWQLWADIMTAGGRYEFAIFRLQQQLKKAPDSAYLQLLIGQLYINTNAYAKAESAFIRASQLAPPASEEAKRALYSLGYLNVSLGKIDEGKQLLEKALNRDSSYFPAITALADLFINTGSLKEAGVLLARARKIEARNSEVLLLLGRYYLKQEDWPRAIEVLDQLLKKEPEHLQGHFFLAQAYRGHGKLEVARQYFQRFDELKRKARTESDRSRGLAVGGVK